MADRAETGKKLDPITLFPALVPDDFIDAGACHCAGAAGSGSGGTCICGSLNGGGGGS